MVERGSDIDTAGGGQVGDAALRQDGTQAMRQAVVLDDGTVRLGAAVQAGAIAGGSSEHAEQAADGDALGGLTAGTQDQDLLARGARFPVPSGTGAKGGPGQPAGQQPAALNPNPGRAFVLETGMVNLGNVARADQILDEAGEGGDIGQAAEDGAQAY